MKNILPRLWEYVESQDTKIAKRVYNAMNKDILNAVVLDGDVVWIEPTYRGAVPDFVFDYVMSWAKRIGYTPLSEI